jgi:HAMP domain-containing protein
MSIGKKVNLMLLITGCIVSCAMATFNYIEAMNRTYDEAYAKAEIISAFALASREYTVKTMRPLMVDLTGPEAFHPEIMGGFFVARAVATLFTEKVPGYSFKQASLDPVNMSNLANDKERDIITFFKENPSVTSKRGVIEQTDGRYIFVATPVMNQKSCLICHGEKEKAPVGRVEKYPGEGGYHWQPDQVVAAFITYIPIEKALAAVHLGAAKTIGIGISGIFLIVLVIAFFIQKKVIAPIVQLTQIADSVSKGHNIQDEIQLNSNDEISGLYKSIDRLRLSILKLLKFARKGDDPGKKPRED